MSCWTIIRSLLAWYILSTILESKSKSNKKLGCCSVNLLLQTIHNINPMKRYPWAMQHRRSLVKYTINTGQGNFSELITRHVRRSKPAHAWLMHVHECGEHIWAFRCMWRRATAEMSLVYPCAHWGSISMSVEVFSPPPLCWWCLCSVEWRTVDSLDLLQPLPVLLQGIHEKKRVLRGLVHLREGSSPHVGVNRGGISRRHVEGSAGTFRSRQMRVQPWTTHTHVSTTHWSSPRTLTLCVYWWRINNYTCKLNRNNANGSDKKHITSR